MVTVNHFCFDSQFTFLPSAQLEHAFRRELASAGCVRRVASGIEIVVRTETWDSEALGRSVGRVLWLEDSVTDLTAFEGLVQALVEHDCYYLRLNQAHSFCRFAPQSTMAPRPIHVATKVTMFTRAKRLSKNTESAVPAIDEIVAEGGEFLDQVAEIAAESFTYNRFANDPHFSDAYIRRMYASWVEQECSKESTRLYAVVKSGLVRSFLLMDVNISPLAEGARVAFISLIASRPEYRDKSLAKALLQFAVSRHCSRGDDYLVANTELRNYPAINFFVSNGFRIQGALNEYHYWSR